MTEVMLTCKLVDGTTIEKSVGIDPTRVSLSRDNLKEIDLIPLRSCAGLIWLELAHNQLNDVDLGQLGVECGVERLSL